MRAKTLLRKSLINFTGYWIYKHKDLPVGCDLITDLRSKIKLPINIIFDVGANNGQTALMFNDNYPRSEIYSFEPVSKTFNKLLNNVKNKKSIKCNKLALGDKAGFVDIKLFKDDASVLNSLNEISMNNTDGFDTERIKVSTGDMFCAENNITEVDLLKIDTEGYEIRVLNGFKNMMKKIKLIYCEVGFNPENKRNTFINDIINFAFENGFYIFGLYEISNIQIKNGNNYGNILLINRNIFVNKA